MSGWHDDGSEQQEQMMKVIDRCGHGILWGRYCPWCREWERGIEAEARRLRQERKRRALPASGES